MGQPERIKLGLLVLLKLWENGELFHIVPLWQVSFREAPAEGVTEGPLRVSRGGHHKLP